MIGQETGGARSSERRGLENVRKRHLISVAANKLGLVIRALVGFSKLRAFLANVGLRLWCVSLPLLPGTIFRPEVRLAVIENMALSTSCRSSTARLYLEFGRCKLLRRL